MQTVLGTPITHLAPSDGPAFLISDLHVPLGGGKVLAFLDAALAAARRERARLLVLGDLFDTYITARQTDVLIWRDVAARFREAHDDGVRIDVLPGNRDFLLGPEFVAASRAQLHPGGLRLRLGGVDTLLLHGDELCQNDLPYQRAKKWLRSRWLRLVARRLPVGLALRAAERARQKSAQVIASGDQSRFLPTRAAVDATFQTGARRLVFGHIHRLATATLPTGQETFVLPAFDATATGYRVDRSGITPVRFEPESVVTSDEPAPLPLR